MQQLVDVVAEYVRQKHANGTSWYTWSFDTQRVPAGIFGLDARGTDWYSRNVTLKHLLHAAWNRDLERRAELERYYIGGWGGVRTNRAETLAAYHASDALANIARGEKGIASWSKALCVRNPFEYAIFDARVSASLNALQIIHRDRVDAPRRFPLLASRNGEVVRATPQLRRYFDAHGWPRVNDDFYGQYLELCRSVGQRNGSPGSPMPIYAVEMALFAHTEELLAKVFPKAA
jgi:hypothetical protein